jgi:sugar lactone lactonase YvrE
MGLAAHETFQQENGFMKRTATLLIVFTFFLTGCYSMRRSHGGGRTSFDGVREISTAAIALPAGYGIEAVARNLTFPTGVTFDQSGTPYVVEAGYSYGEVWTTPRLLRINPDGTTSVVASGGNNGPWNGVTFADGAFFIAEGGEREGGRILRITPDGRSTALIEKLPSVGDHHTNGPVPGPDGFLYFGQGTATNSGVVGEDNADFGWLRRYPEFHDIPCRDITLAGINYTSGNPLQEGSGQVTTGAFVPFGTPTSPGQVIRGQVPCSGSIMRVRPDGSGLDLVAWGFRNPFGLAFTSDGRLFVTENGYDVRGSRPVFGTGDLLREVRRGLWHGWPDTFGHVPFGDGFAAPGRSRPGRLLQAWPNDPPVPAARLGVHSSSNGLDFDRGGFGTAGWAYIAQFGDMTPSSGKVLNPVGFKVVRVNPANGNVEDFAVNRGFHNGPASMLNNGGLERPVAVRFDPSGNALYVVDFGVMTIGSRGPEPRQGTGVLWRISRR